MQWLKKFRLWLFKKKLNYAMRNYDRDVCCCGDNIPDHGYCTFPGMCRSQVEYHTSTSIERRRKELGL